MTRDEVNKILAKADGYVDHGPIGSGHPPGSEIPVCLTCHQILLVRRGETKSRVSCPRDYTTSYPDLARVEKIYYHDDHSLCLYTSPQGLGETEVTACQWDGTGAYDDYEIVRIVHESELHARAECLARVILEQEKDNAD